MENEKNVVGFVDTPIISENETNDRGEENDTVAAEAEDMPTASAETDSNTSDTDGNTATADNNASYADSNTATAVTPLQFFKSTAGKIVLCLSGIAVIAIIIVSALLLSLPNIDSIKVANDSIEMTVNETQTVKYTIMPKSSKDVAVKFTSSDDSVATVNEKGKITAKKAGGCRITVKAGRKTDTISVSVINPLKAAYKNHCQSSFAELGADGSYLEIDTNPLNRDDYTDYEAYLAIMYTNNDLNLPDSLLTHMNSTNALSGRQSRTYDNYTVTWSYHPDNGLEVIYEMQ